MMPKETSFLYARQTTKEYTRVLRIDGRLDVKSLMGVLAARKDAEFRFQACLLWEFCFQLGGRFKATHLTA